MSKDSVGKLFSWSGILWTVVLSFGFTVLLRLFIFTPYVVPSGSMENTLSVGARVVATGPWLNGTPLGDVHYGSIVIVRDDANWLKGTKYSGDTLVKRVIGLPGDTVEGKEDGSILVNGEVIDEPYAQFDTEKPGGLPMSANVFDVTVPDDSIFIMGDNRLHSYDSRRNGTVLESSVVGVLLFHF